VKYVGKDSIPTLTCKPIVIVILVRDPTSAMCVVRHFYTVQISGSTSKVITQRRMQSASTAKFAAGASLSETHWCLT
jgi:hypothetical protein